MAAGRFYEIQAGDVWQAQDFALKAAEASGQLEPTRKLIDSLAESSKTDAFVRTQLREPYGVRRPNSI